MSSLTSSSGIGNGQNPPCLRRNNSCSCVLCENGWDDGIAIPILKEKFQKMFLGNETLTILANEINCYWLTALYAMQAGNYEKAVWCFRHYELTCFHDFFYQHCAYLLYHKGLLAYLIKDYAFAEKLFERYLQNEMFQEDEIAYLHLGNAFFRQEMWDKALEAYGSALELRKSFAEVIINIGLVSRKLGDNATAETLASNSVLFNGIFTRGTLCENPLEYTLAIPANLSIWDIPIFINARDRLGTLQKLVDWLLQAGYRRIYILDNDSTYPPLLDYYRRLEQNVPQINVIRLGRNIGHRALWEAGILETMQVDTPYVYTDPDVVPVKECPSNVLQRMLEILQKYPFLKKVGLGLKTDDLTYYGADATREWESQFYLHPMEEGLYFATVDTTFALYRNYRHYNLYCSARITGKYMVHHLPWYLDYDNLPEDEKYYIQHANTSSSVARGIQKGPFKL